MYTENVKNAPTRLMFTTLLAAMFICVISALGHAQQQGPPKVPVRAAKVANRVVSEQISLIGTAEAISNSTVASEISGIVEHYPVKEGDFVKAGDLLVRLKDTDLQLRLKATRAVREGILASLENAEKELERVTKLRESKSISETKFDTAYYAHLVLKKRLLENDAEIEKIEYEISRKKVAAPFSGVVAKEHTQVGEWINAGGPIVTLLDLREIRITVDVPERYIVNLSPKSPVSVVVTSVSSDPLKGRIYAILPRGDAAARTIPIRIILSNPGSKIKSGMEAVVTFTLATKKDALLVPKDAVVMAGNERLVFTVLGGKVMPVMVNIIGYYDSEVAVKGNLKPDDLVVTRGNERLRPGQAVQVVP